MTVNQDFASLSEGEKIVRSYQCTQLRQLFTKPTIGHLTITNKRLVFHSESKSIGAENAIIAEIPLEDVGGINSMIGTSFNVFIFLLVATGLFFATLVFEAIFPEFITGWWGGILLTLPYLVGLLFERQILSPDIGKKIVENMEGTAVQDVFRNVNASLVMKILKILFLVGFPLLARNIAQEIPIFGWILLIAAYFLLYVMVFGKSRAFGLQILSKQGGHSPITIHGNLFFAIFNPSNTAAKTMNAAPTEESESIVRELGALITDIQQMGDLGIEKWTRD